MNVNGWVVVGSDTVLVLKYHLCVPYIASAKSWSVRGASYQPAFIDSCLLVTYTGFYICPVYLLDELVLGVRGSVFFFFLHVVLVLWRVGAILRNERGIQGQNYVAMLQA